MATGRSKLPTDSLWLLCLLLLLILTVWWIPGRGAAGHRDSLSASRGGKKLFYDLVVRLHPIVQRELVQLVPDPSVDTYLLLGPNQYPNRAGWEELYNWVASGKTLLFAARWGDPAVDLAPFPAHIRPNHSGGLLESLGADSSRASPSTAFELPEFPDIDTVDLSWRSQGTVELGEFETGYEPHVLVNSGGTQAVAVPIGLGYLIVCATDDPFTNQSVRKPAGALLATRILESGVVVGPISFSEVLNRSGGPGGFSLLFDPDFRAFTLQLLIGLVLFLWATARRFGPPLPSPPGHRRATSEHAKALGELYRKRKHGTHVLAHYLDYIRERTRLTPDDDTVDLLERAGKLVQSSSLDNRSAASMIRQLARHFDSE